MRKILVFLFLNFVFSNTVFGESFYFKKCKLNNNLTADYVIDVEKKIINVTLTTSDNVNQNLTDGIDSIEKNQIISKKIKSGKGKEDYFVYYLDAESDSVIKQEWKKEKGIDIFRPFGQKKQSYCLDVKADWDKVKIDQNETDKEKKEILKAQEELLKKQKTISKCEGTNFKNWNNCKGVHTAESGEKYRGFFKNGEIIEGVADYPGGGMYIGAFKNFKPHGKGNFIWESGKKYLGEWKNGKSYGNGIKTWPDGKKYTGKFINDKFDGKGTFVYPDGSKYVGEYKNGKRHGDGTLTYSDGKTYIGNFVAGYEHGEGTCFNPDGSNIPCKKDISTTGKNTHNILVTEKKWIKLSEYNSQLSENLKKKFEEKAEEFCGGKTNYETLEKKIEIVEMDETPAFGIETVIKIGVNGVIECK